MKTINSIGSGYYNYYHQSNKYETKDGKAKEVWYRKDLSKEEIGNNNSGVMNRESENADMYRKLEDAYANVSVANRSRYKTTQELETAVYAKYFDIDSKYLSYSKDERWAMYANEVHMTEFGCIGGSVPMFKLLKDPHLNGEVTKNTYESSHSREFNEKMLSQQISNVFNNNGIDISLLGNTKFRFAVNGFTNKLMIAPLSIDKNSSINAEIVKKMTEALNSNDNAKNLFYNLLYDGNRNKLIDKAQLSKWSIYSNFKQVTGLDIRNFNQSANGFVDNDGNLAKNLFKEALQTTSKVPKEFKNAAYDYFIQQENEVNKYNFSSTPELTLSLEYQNGEVKLQNASKNMDIEV